MEWHDLTNAEATGKGGCVYPIKNERGFTELCGEVTLLDNNGNHYAFCTEHRKAVEDKWRQVRAKKQARLAAGRKRKIKPFEHMVIGKVGE